MSYNRCKDTHKFGNKYLPSAYKTQVDFRSHFSGKKVRLIVREVRYKIHAWEGKGFRSEHTSLPKHQWKEAILICTQPNNSYCVFIHACNMKSIKLQGYSYCASMAWYINQP